MSGRGRTRTKGVDLTPFVPRLLLAMPDPGGPVVQEVEGSLLFIDLSGFTAMSERLARRGRVGAEEVTTVIGSTFSELLAVAYGVGGSLLKFGGDALLLAFVDDGHAGRATHAAFEMRRTLRRIGQIATSAGIVRLRMSAGVSTGPLHLFIVGESHRELMVAGPTATRVVRMEAAAAAGQIVIDAETASELAGRHVGHPCGTGYLLRGNPQTAGLRWPDQPVPEHDAALHVPTRIREHVLAGGSEPEHRQVAVAFIHFDGIDDLVVADGPNEAARRLHALVCLAQGEVEDAGVSFIGTDVDADGGKIILAAGAPLATEEDDEQILRVARNVVLADVGLGASAGVHRGPAFTGEVGPAYRRTYTVMGDAVNTAARVMTRARPRQVLSTASVIDRIETPYDLRQLPPFVAKGKKAPLIAYDVGPVLTTRAAHMSTAKVVGREEELAAIGRQIDRAIGGLGGCITIRGEAGIGKTALVDAVRARHPSVQWIAAGCMPYHTATAYHAVRQILRAALALDETAGEPELKRLLNRIDPAFVPWAPLIGAVLGIEVAATGEVAHLEERRRATMLADVVLRLVDACLDESVVIAVEDGHWIDESSRALLQRLADSSAHRPRCVLVTERPREEPTVRGGARLDLGPLTETAARSLISAASADCLLPDQIDAVLYKSGCRPMFLLELVGALRRGGGDLLPESVEQLITARIDRLRPPDRAALRHLAVLGTAFPAEHLSLVGGSSPPDLRRLTEFVGRFGSEVRFHQALVRDAAYEGLPLRRRRELHEKLARHLESEGALSSALAFHFHHAGIKQETWRYSVAAGIEAEESYAYPEAVAHFRRALAVRKYVEPSSKSALGDVWRRLGQALWLTGRLKEALGAMSRARPLIEDRPTLAKTQLQEGHARMSLGQLDLALRASRRGLMALGEGELDPEARKQRVRLLILRATVRNLQGRYDDAADLLRTVPAEARANGDRAGLLHALDCLVLVGRGRRDLSAIELGREAIELSAEIGDPRVGGNVASNAGLLLTDTGRWDEAAALYTRSIALCEEGGDPLLAAIGRNNLGDIRAKQGRLAEAERWFEESFSAFNSAGHLYASLVRLELARVRARQGRPEEAIEMIRQSRTALEAAHVPHLVVQADLSLAECLIATGFAQRAFEVLASCENPDTEYLATRHRLSAEAARRLGLLDAARASVREALTIAIDGHDPYEEALASEVAAKLADTPEEVVRLLARRDEVFAQLGVVQAPIGEAGVLEAAT